MNNNKLPETPNDVQSRQFTNYLAESPQDFRDALQVSTGWSDCEIRATIRTVDIKDDVYMSLCRKDGYKQYFEPKTRAYNEFGRGGKLQYETRKELIIEKLEKWNGSSWEIIY